MRSGKLRRCDGKMEKERRKACDQMNV